MITLSRIDLPAIAGKQETLKVPFIAEPEPYIKWTFNGDQKLPESCELTTDRNVAILTIGRATKLHEGEYTVKISNAYGRAELTANVILIGEKT